MPEEEGERRALKREVEFYGLSGMKEKLEKHSAGVAGKIYVVGGVVKDGHGNLKATESVEICDRGAGQWKQVRTHIVAK